MGFLRFLNRQPADPLERFAELGRAESTLTPTPQKAQLDGLDEAAPLAPVAMEKEAGGEVVVHGCRDGRRMGGGRRSYVWISQKTRESRVFPEQLFRPF